ncbi:imidazole glycerol phosphate synthase subunit HisH [Parasynechococcus marenigrum]|uniref:Imidazole glycerol phosphate synthase subunit HisH 1 n=1 Tax=Parasynechococcus marenigrum (strain WH8102) TaxID=84588 RepID=HIS51_PARMW|nr:imidazole glycerol phosphate synthase subunit HisH [Parasynechococcus marenigrum]Q7U924.1 RecName: Full=Imidazole glycerol phosphate synthase subunit HisH 1; AltName: Full=IGP synthase glutaminase subunit 1; AltName: Full=IGP synthase subunit HisH 1; AltName: Full=ImGP synthase subunit HisH 1; Short=IGPS subunit HisH 1 [Parasynechococcus marenigrum WH 8102]CAE06950.1 putative glutamine amidotransferase [Parasynechococcus marenigrum WH 8102]
MSKIAIVDYGMCNLWSIKSAIQFIGYDSILTSDPKDILNSSAIILPGVGSFKTGMDNLLSLGLSQAIIDACMFRSIPILGICLGFQLLCCSSEEPSYTKGLSLLPIQIVPLCRHIDASFVLPHVGFTSVYTSKNDPLFKNIANKSDFYFVHSYGAFNVPHDFTTYSYCNYDAKIISSANVNHIMGVQFHPEKSQTNGLILLDNFLSFSNV